METSVATEIKNLHELKNQGIISNDEFEKQKQTILSGRQSRKTHPSKRIGAAVIALFFGGLGLHKFYTGKPLMGLFYLLFCWTFIPAFFAFIEGIIYLLSSDETFNRNHDKTHPNYAPQHKSFRLT